MFDSLCSVVGLVLPPPPLLLYLSSQISPLTISIIKVEENTNGSSREKMERKENRNITLEKKFLFSFCFILLLWLILKYKSPITMFALNN